MPVSACNIHGGDYAGNTKNDGVLIHALIDVLAARDESLDDYFPEITDQENRQLTILYGTSYVRIALLLLALAKLKANWFTQGGLLEFDFWAKVKKDWHARFVENESE